MSFRSAIVSTLATGLLLTPAASAVTVSGQVTDEQAVGIFNVDVDFFDRNLGQIIFTPNDNTDFSGFYAVSVPPSEYDITFNAPAGSPYLDVELRQVDITANTVIDVTMPVGMLVSGNVTDVASAPLFNVDLDFYDVALRSVIDTGNDNNDNTDINGLFGVRVPSSTYDIRFIAPLGQPYAGAELKGVAVAGSLSIGTIALEPGLFVSGSVLGAGAATVSNADLDFEDLATGEVIFTPRDNSDSVGTFNVPVPAGFYDVTVAPPTGSGLAWKTLYGVDVQASLAVGAVQLDPGFALTGNVRDEAAQIVAGGDLDMIDLGLGQELATPNDNADATGAFSLLAPATTMDLVAYPPTGAVLAAAVLRDVVVSGNTNVGTVTLPTGFSVSGTVTSGGLPVPGADIDAIDTVVGRIYPTAHDDSDPAGAYSIRLPIGTYLLIANPPAGSSLDADSVFVLPLDSDRVIHFDLPGSAVSADVRRTTSGLALHPSVPNPFRSSARIAFEVPRGVRAARIAIYDVTGRMVREYDRAGLTAGRHSVVWDGRDGRGRAVASGIYHYRLEAAGRSESRKMIVLR